MLTSPLPSPTPEPTPPRKRRPNIRQFAGVLAIVLLVAGFGGTLLVIHAAPHAPRVLGAGPGATPTPTGPAGATTTPAGTPDATPGTTPGATPVPPATPGPTATPAPPGDVVVTQNQDMRPVCLDGTARYTVVLDDEGDTAANWHVSIPQVIMSIPSIRSGLPQRSSATAQRLNSPRSSSPYWAQVLPQDGSVAPGQTASFVMVPLVAMPCGGAEYHAAVQLTFPSGATEPDIPLTYAGTGPSPNSNVVLVAGSLTNTEACPASGTAPAPFTFAIQNTGNAFAVPVLDTTKDTVAGRWWADASVTYNPPNPTVSDWLYPGETWTVTITPIAGVLCDGTVYHVYVEINNAQGTHTTITLTDTFH